MDAYAALRCAEDSAGDPVPELGAHTIARFGNERDGMTGSVAWGANDHGQLGTGRPVGGGGGGGGVVLAGTVEVAEPTRVTDLDDVEVVGFAAGGRHTLASTRWC